jgi:death-on-curing protein
MCSESWRSDRLAGAAAHRRDPRRTTGRTRRRHRRSDDGRVGALCAIAIARDHPFVDGNKLTAFAALFTFLALKGMEFESPEVDATVMMLRLAAGNMPVDECTTCVRNNTRPQGA